MMGEADSRIEVEQSMRADQSSRLRSRFPHGVQKLATFTL